MDSEKCTTQVTLGDTKTKALIDTGANISVINKNSLSTTTYADKALNPSHVKQVLAANGNHVKVLGKISIDVTIGSRSFTQTFHVLDQLHHNLILGFDFMKTHGAFLNFGNCTLELNDNPNIAVGSITLNSGLVRTKKAVTIPSNSETLIGVSVSKQSNNSTVLLEPLEAYIHSLQKLVVAKCLVKVQNGKAMLKILNPTPSDVRIQAHKIIAKISSVDTNAIYSLDDVTPNVSSVSNCDETSSTSKASDSSGLTFDLQNSCLSPQEKQRLLTFLQANKSIFATSLKELGCTHLYKHHIDTIPGARRSHPYRQTSKVRADQDRQVSELKDIGIIEPSTSNWASPVVMCFKKSEEMRMAIDYRKLNAVTVPQTFPLPHIDSVFDAIGEAKAQYFSCVDLKSGFHRVPLTEESKHKSAFITQTGVYQFTRMPFGLMNSPITFQAMMSHVLRGLNWKYVLVYVDDILIFLRTFQEHLNHLSQVFDRLHHANLKLHPQKCNFAVNEIKFLGYIISRDGVKVDPEKTSAINKVPVPQTQKQLRSVLGMANFYRRFIKNYSKIVSPLHALLHKDKPIKLK